MFKLDNPISEALANIVLTIVTILVVTWFTFQGSEVGALTDWLIPLGAVSGLLGAAGLVYYPCVIAKERHTLLNEIYELKRRQALDRMEANRRDDEQY